MIIVGVLMLVAPIRLSLVVKTLDRFVVGFDWVLKYFRVPFGIFLLLLAVWLGRHIILYPVYQALLIPLVLLFVFFGLIIIVFPQVMAEIYAFTNRVVLNTDELIMRTRPLFSLIFIVIGLCLVLIYWAMR